VWVRIRGGEDPGPALLPTRVFNAISSPSFSAAQNSLPGFLITGGSREAQTSFAGRSLPDRLPSKDGSERLIVMTSGHPQRMKIAIFLNAIYRHMAIFKVNPPWSLRPVPDLLLSEPTQNGREPNKEMSIVSPIFLLIIIREIDGF